LQLAALLPEQKVLMAFDLVFSPSQYAFSVVDHFDHWMIILESLKALQGYDTITIGHDSPVHRYAIDSTITYVKRAKEIREAWAVWGRNPLVTPGERSYRYKENEQRARAGTQRQRITASGAAIFSWLAPPVRALISPWHRVQAFHQYVGRKQRVDRECQLRLVRTEPVLRME
jgi:hypothetical protein